jgi:hypothetical protein
MHGRTTIKKERKMYNGKGKTEDKAPKLNKKEGRKRQAMYV